MLVFTCHFRWSTTISWSICDSSGYVGFQCVNNSFWARCSNWDFHLGAHWTQPWISWHSRMLLLGEFWLYIILGLSLALCSRFNKYFSIAWKLMRIVKERWTAMCCIWFAWVPKLQLIESPIGSNMQLKNILLSVSLIEPLLTLKWVKVCVHCLANWTWTDKEKWFSLRGNVLLMSTFDFTVTSVLARPFGRHYTFYGIEIPWNK